MTKLERVQATLNHQPVDRCAVLEQLSYNPRVIADWSGKLIQGFDYTVDDICAVIRQTCDLVMPPAVPRGTARVTTPDGFVIQNDNWTSWHVSRPFTDAEGTRDWLRAEVRRHIRETRALETGGLFVASSSEINPPIPPENFRVMVEAAWEDARRNEL